MKRREKEKNRRNEEIEESIEEERRRGNLIRWVVVPLEKRKRGIGIVNSLKVDLALQPIKNLKKKKNTEAN